MRGHRHVTLLLFLLTLCHFALAQGPFPGAFVLAHKPAALYYKFDADQQGQMLQLTTSTADEAIYSKVSGRIYVFDNVGIPGSGPDPLAGFKMLAGKFRPKPTNVIPIDLRERRELASFPLGGNARMLCSSDNGSMVAASVITDERKGSYVIETIDLTSGRVTPLYSGPREATENLNCTEDGRYVIAIVAKYGGLSIPRRLLILKSDGSGPVLEEDLKKFTVKSFSLAEENKLLVLGNNKGVPNRGEFRVYDMATGRSLSSVEVAGDPVKLIRLGAAYWVVTTEAMHPITAVGAVDMRLIPLNVNDGSPGLPGYPGHGLLLPDGRIAITVVKKSDQAPVHTALVNLTSGKVEGIVETGRAGVRAVKKAEFLFGAVLAGTGGIAVPPREYSAEVVAGPGAKQLFVLNTESNDVTVIDAVTFRQTAVIPVDGSITRLWIAPDSAWLFCIGTSKVQSLDTSTAAHTLTDVALSDGVFDKRWAVPQFSAEDGGSKLTVFTAKGETLVWDGRTGALVVGSVSR